VIVAVMGWGSAPRSRSWTLFRFYQAVLAADIPETTRLAETISTWWPAIEAFLRLRVTNARTEGSNRIIKQLKRIGCGYRNQANYERRIVLHVAAKSAAWQPINEGTSPSNAKSRQRGPRPRPRRPGDRLGHQISGRCPGLEELPAALWLSTFTRR
jgi:Transposase